MPITRGKIYFDKNGQDQDDNPDMELFQTGLPSQKTFQTYKDINKEGQHVPSLPQKIQQCSSPPVEDLTDKFVSLKSVQDSPDKATTSLEPTEESIKIFPDPADENLTTTAYTSFYEPLVVPSVQVVDFLPFHRTDYQFLSNSFVCDCSELDPYYFPDKFSLWPDQLQFSEYDPAKCPQRPFRSSAVPLLSSDLQDDKVSPCSRDTTWYSDAFLSIFDEFSLYVDSVSHDLEQEHLNIPENRAKQSSEPTALDASNQTTESFGDVALRLIEHESVEPIDKDIPKPDNESISVEPEQRQEECVPPEVCNTDWDPTEETELPSLEDAGESVVVPIPNGTLRPETHNIVDLAIVAGLTTAPCHKPGPELPEASAVYKPFPPHQEPHPDNEEIPTAVERPINQVKEVPAHLVQETFLLEPMPIKSSDTAQRQDSGLLEHPIADLTFLESTTPPRPFDLPWIDSGGGVRYISSNSTAYTGRIGMLCLTGFINGRLPKHNTPLCPCETVTVGVG